MLILLMGTHIYMTVKTRFIQKKIPLAIKLSVSKDSNNGGGVGQFSTLATSLASTIGTGNILGIGTAISIGGAGAVFWIWVSGVLAIATKYAETYIGVKYRVKANNGEYLGGAMYALEKRLNSKYLAKAFALFTAIAGFGIGSSLQSNAIAQTLTDTIDLNRELIINFGDSQISVISVLATTVTAILVALVIFGGVNSITKICEVLVPVMSLFFVVGSIVILILNKDYLSQAINLIVTSAFTSRAGFGGFVGSTFIIACRVGVSKGLFTNEAGIGSSPIISASTDGDDIVKTSLIASSAVFWDTVVLCLLTGVVMVSSVLACNLPDDIILSGSEISLLSFERIPCLGGFFLTVAMIAFAFATIIGWAVYGIQGAKYLFGDRITKPYQIMWVIVVFISGFVDMQTMWNIGDILNAFMAIPNVFAILLLADEISKDTKLYFKKK